MWWVWSHWWSFGPHTQLLKQHFFFRCLTSLQFFTLECVHFTLGFSCGEICLTFSLQTWNKFEVCCSVALLCLTLCDPMGYSTPGFPVLTISQSLLRLMIQWCHPTISSSNVPFSSCPQSFPVSGSFPVRWLFISGEGYWSFNFSISRSNEYSGLISFRIDWFDLLAVQGTLKSLLQHHSSKASILWRSVFFMLQLSHPYMTTGKTIGSF